MGSIRVRKENNKLYFDFRYKGVRCREQTALTDNPANRRKLEKVLKKIEAEITLDTFDYQRYFPNSKLAAKFDQATTPQSATETLLFGDFAWEWFEEMQIGWKASHQETIRIILNRHLIPAFGDQAVSRITKSDILKLRASLAKVERGNSNVGLSPQRINHIMNPLRQILNEAADRFHFTTPFTGAYST